MHRFDTVVRLQHTDAAGVIFFARLFDLAHLALEDLLDTLGQPLPPDLASAAVGYPVVRAAADYSAPLRLGDRLTIAVRLRDVSERRFTLAYRFLRPDGEQAAAAELTHAAARLASGRGAPALPESLLAALRGWGAA